MPRLAHVALPVLLAAVAFASTPARVAAKGAPAKPAKGAPTRAEVVARALARLDEDALSTARDMNEQHRIFTQSVAGLCFLLDPAGGKGAPHPDRVDRCAESIGRYVDGAARWFEAATKERPGDEMSAFQWSQPTWALSAAAIFFAEAAARGVRRREATGRLRTIGELLAASQQPDGGFGHDREGRPRMPELEIPLPGGGVKKMKYPATLLSASAWAGTAMGLARTASGKKLDAPIGKAKAYFAANREPEGTYPYDPSQKGSGGGSDVTTVARTAGAFVALRALGVSPKEKDLARTGSFLVRRVEDLAEGHGSSPHGVFFGRIASLLLGPAATKAYDEAIVPRILGAADPETGALDCICRKAGGTTCESFRGEDNFALRMAGPDALGWVRGYVTALNLFALLAEKGRLRHLDGVPVDDGPAPETTPSEPSGPGVPPTR
jgi:hypothetical protein